MLTRAMSSLQLSQKRLNRFVDKRRKYAGDDCAPGHPASNLVTGVLGLVVALVIYLAYKDRSRYVAYQSLQAIIFQLVFFFGAAILAVVVALVSTPLVLVCIGLFGLVLALLLALVPIGALIYGIVAAVETNHGRDFQYWLVGQWVRKTYEG